MMTEDQEYEGLKTLAAKIGALTIGSWVFHNYNYIMGGIFTTLSCFYLVWKWRMDYLKIKRFKNES